MCLEKLYIHIPACACMWICMCTRMCNCVCMCVHVHVVARGWCQVFFPLLSWSLALADSPRWASQWAWDPAPPLSQGWDYRSMYAFMPAFYVGVGELNSHLLLAQLALYRSSPLSSPLHPFCSSAPSLPKREGSLQIRNALCCRETYLPKGANKGFFPSPSPFALLPHSIGTRSEGPCLFFKPWQIVMNSAVPVYKPGVL